MDYRRQFALALLFSHCKHFYCCNDTVVVCIRHRNLCLNVELFQVCLSSIESFKLKDATLANDVDQWGGALILYCLSMSVDVDRRRLVIALTVHQIAIAIDL